MKILNWMQSKLNGKQRTNKTNSGSGPAAHHLKHETCKEEFSDWPNGLLAIGTFGNNSLKDQEKVNGQEILSACQDHSEEITHEEARELHKELKLLLHKEPILQYNLSDESAKQNFPAEKFFDFLQTLEHDRSNGEIISDGSLNKNGHLQGSSSAVHCKGNGNHLDKTKGISRRSLSFLLRKACRRASRSKLTPMLIDPVGELKLEKSRMEKILRTMLHKKIYPRSSNTKAPAKKCLHNKDMPETDSEDETPEKTSDGSKWVNTDTNFIVLEI